MPRVTVPLFFYSSKLHAPPCPWGFTTALPWKNLAEDGLKRLGEPAGMF
ncbi:hypothetical protein HNQ38_001529 [Desulfovibrio intestinalis]|uniref:Uncharacterized protein n=1 Tax=Desulfovibrio intestinalis TaxID=58621 RepID=A0A7W8FH39_9BACT|nr:hypothetical protein [Desulfovibrio intestinalis]